MIKRDSIVSQTNEFEVTDLDEEKVIMNLDKGKYFSLNSMGSVIWEIIGEEISVKKIIELLMCEYEVEESICEDYVFEYLINLENIDLIKVI